jgi:apolipoprotein N-acyltransferase
MTRARALALPVAGVVAGTVVGLGQPPWSMAWVAVAALVAVVVVVARDPGPRSAASAGFRRGWLAGVGYFAVTLFWIVEPFLVAPDRHGWMAPFALILMVGGMALFWGLAGAVAGWLGRGAAGRALAFGLALAATELLRAHVLTGFPWALIGYIWVEVELIQWASVVGIHGVTLVTTLAAGTAAAALVLGGLRRWLVLVPLTVLAALYLLGHRHAVPDRGDLSDRPVVRIVQPNADQRLKWDPDWAQAFYERQVNLTAERDPGRPPPDLVIWPEAALPTLLDQSGDLLADVAAAAGEGAVILGITRAEGMRYFNSAVVLAGDGNPLAVYDKHHLVPFGEYIPLGDLLSRAGIGAFAARFGFGFTPGPGPRTVPVGGRIGSVLPLICYEAIFPAHARTSDRPTLLVQLTNDAWFGTVAGPWQHLAQARVRAIEQRLPLARSANTGISALIDPTGRIVDSLALGTAGRIDAPLPRPWDTPAYARRGDAPVIALMAVLAVLMLVWRMRNAR